MEMWADWIKQWTALEWCPNLKIIKKLRKMLNIEVSRESWKKKNQVQMKELLMLKTAFHLDLATNKYTPYLYKLLYCFCVRYGL